jgi:hypothetical protein
VASNGRQAQWLRLRSKFFGVIEVKIPEKLLDIANGQEPLDLVQLGWPRDKDSLTEEQLSLGKSVRRIVRQQNTYMCSLGLEWGAITCW